MRPHQLGLRSRFILLVVAGVGLVSAAMAVVTFMDSRDALIESRQEFLYTLAQGQSNALARRLIEVGGPAQDLADTLEVLPVNDEKILIKLIRKHLLASRRIYGLGVAFEPYAFEPGRKLVGPYLYRSKKGIKFYQLGTEAYNYPRWDWYLLPSLLKRGVWIEPYFGSGGQAFMTTYSAPILHQGKVSGVVAADFALDDLDKKVTSMPVGRTGWAFVLSSQGAFLAAPNREWIMRETIFSLAEELHRPDLRRLGKRMIRGAAGVVDTIDWHQHEKAWLGFHPVKGLGWSLGVVMPEKEVLEPAYALAKKQALAAAIGLAAMCVVVWLLVMSLTRPLQKLAAAARRLASGDLSTRVADVRPGDEVGDLAGAFNTMVDDLNRYIEELTTTTAAKERIQSELDLAKQIQQSILPRIYPAFPDREEFDLFAKNIPAREVGGDFYDFFFVDENRLAMVVGDVSGKGIPAALFMTVATTLIKNAAHHHVDPAEVLSEVNNQIEPGNEMCMFVTVFYCVLDIRTGEMVYASGGHPAPLLRRASGEVSHLPQVKGSAVGILPILQLEEGSITLKPGDVLLVYTDGLDEAINAKDEMFGLERAAQWLDRAEITDGPSMIKSLEQAHRAFTGDVEQFDDLTLLIFRRKK